MKFRLLLLIYILGLGVSYSVADEGLWLFNAPPKAQIKAKYGFEVTDPWLKHLQLSSVRFDYGSGAFVSADGLVLTNHHVASECLHSLSTAANNYLKTGFYAKNREHEARCPDLELDVLEQITDVTTQVNAVVKPGMPSADASKAQHSAIAVIEKDCAGAADILCEVVTIYSGSSFHLYRYKKYTDIRLVFAPEFSAAFFGGDPENFQYPRFDLDIAFFRAYENGNPVHPADHLEWAKQGVQEGDLVFVSGNPGISQRLQTLNQTYFLKTIQYPFVLKDYQRRIEVLQNFASQSAENERMAHQLIFKLQNSSKAYTGFIAALNDQNMMHHKTLDERLQLLRFRNSPIGRKAFTAFLQTDKALETYHAIFVPHRFLELQYGFRGELAWFARTLVRVGEEKNKPDGERLYEYRDSALPSLESDLLSSAPVYKQLEAVELADSLSEMQKQLGADNPVVIKVLQGKTPEDVANDAIAHTHLDDVAFRKQLYDGGAAAIAHSNDPLIMLMRAVDPDARAVRKRFDTEVDSVIQQNGAFIIQSRLQRTNSHFSPDATFTLRLSYGQVKGYTEDGQGYLPKGTKVPAQTDLGGAFAHAQEHDNKPPYTLPDSWMAKRKKLSLKTPLNFVSTVDILGGSSGSPVINKNGELVGVIFDGNIQSLTWRFMYDDTVGRGVSVDSRAILEALKKIYKADELVKELTQKAKQDKK